MTQFRFAELRAIGTLCDYGRPMQKDSADSLCESA